MPSTGQPPKDMAIIQCVGSRDVRRGAPYCSKACCKYAYKLGRQLRSLYPELKLTFFLHGLEAAGGSPGRRWGNGLPEDDKVRIVRSRPSEVLPGTGRWFAIPPPRNRWSRRASTWSC